MTMYHLHPPLRDSQQQPHACRCSACGQESELEALAQALAASVKGVEPAPEAEPAQDKPRGFVCKICGFIYESDTLPEDYTCPICRRPASDFEPVR